MGRAGEERLVGGMAVAHFGVVESGDEAEVAAMLTEQFKVRRGGVIGALLGGKKVRRVKAEIVQDADEPPWCHRFGGERGVHRVEPRQGERDPGAFEERAAGERAACREGDVFHGGNHLWRKRRL